MFDRCSYKVWEINIAVCTRLEFDDSRLIYCMGYDFYMYVNLISHLNTLSIDDVMYDITTTPEGTLL